MNLFYKKFSDLTIDELYAILKLRVSIFIVEQKCPYMELDDLDQKSIHVWYEENGTIQAYLRILDRETEHQDVTIGRVISIKRRCGLGSQILSEGIRIAKDKFHADKIYLEAQTYAKKMYEKQGFKQISDEFSIDGIPHVKMILECQ